MAFTKAGKDFGTPESVDLFPSFNISRRSGPALVYFFGLVIVPADIVTTPFQLLVYGGSIVHARSQVRRMKRSLLDFIRTGEHTTRVRAVVRLGEAEAADKLCGCQFG